MTKQNRVGKMVFLLHYYSVINITSCTIQAPALKVPFSFDPLCLFFVYARGAVPVAISPDIVGDRIIAQSIKMDELMEAPQLAKSVVYQLHWLNNLQRRV